MAKAYGVYNNNGAATTCPAGSYCPGDFNATLCSPGTYSKAQATRCTSCPPGQVTLEPGATACQTCDEGFYEVGRSGCLPCNEAGYYCAGGQRFDCPDINGLACFGGNIVAVFGFFLDDERVLQGCAPGHFCPGDLQSHVCAAGTYTESANATTCNPCPKGLHQPEEGATTCTPCPGGQYQDKEGSLGCNECRPGFFCTAGTPEETMCPKGHSIV